MNFDSREETIYSFFMKSKALNRTLFALPALLLAGAAHTLSPPPPQPDDELFPLLYEAFDGDNWHRNDGWLDEEVYWCDWYGVTCSDDAVWGYYDFLALDLADNNLSGELTEELSRLLFEHIPPRFWLDLSNNEITGQLRHFPAQTRRADLSGNRISGRLPKVETSVIHEDDKHLVLARNRFEGAVPDNWADLRLRELNLADNQLDDGHLNAFRAISPTVNGRLDLAGNRFSGQLTTSIYTAGLNRNDSSNVGGGLRLCFNDFSLFSETMHEWISERHAGGPEFEQCLGRERIDMDAGISGSWFNPAFDGEGVALQLLDNGAPLLYSFGFDRQGRQQWLFEVGRPGQQFLKWQPLKETRGDFGQGFRYDGDHPLMRGMTRMRFDRIDDDTVHVERNYYDLAACGPLETADPNRPPTMPCPPPLFADRLDYQRLTELAGTTCGNQTDAQHYSGAWFNPETNGEGFVIEVLPDDRAVVYWFTYAADGSGEQAWLMGDGQIDLNISVIPSNPQPPRLLIDPILQPVGATYGPDFDPADVERINWGWLEIQFHDENTGHVFFYSMLEAYGSGDFPIQRLARPMLADCE